MSTLHVVSLPHTQLTDEYAWCAYTQKVRRFAPMMLDQGFDVVVYGGDEHDLKCTEYVTIFNEAMRQFLYGSNGTVPVFNVDNFGAVNQLAISAVRQRANSGDTLCIIGGSPQKPIADALPHLRCVEYGIGYEGTFARFRVFESYAWMHAVYGAQHKAMSADGVWFDAVVPNYFDPIDFPYGEAEREDFLLYLGRVATRKGYAIAVEVAEAAGRPLVIAGAGEPEEKWRRPHVTYLGNVDPKVRATLLGTCHALLAPTVYLEPFGGSVVEAMLCGTPVITTDWGAFTETVRPGLDGYRCRTLAEFLDAIDNVAKLPRFNIRADALSRFSLAAVGPQYRRYFDRLDTIDNAEGWYTR